ncbi:hypothetical protein GE061_019063 [Apolygus lucorum]|uniref:Uncharacterized protein n=1 Tax=Apolygus lucorum TaxID=248454 RepID=A0A8S9X8N0_APOLU|nr:hypothetical protein GE061_019063 [Apolygus lucorum]
MTLPGNQNSPSQVPNSGTNLEVKPVTPNASPQSSPVPSTKNQHKREPSITGSKESVPDRSDVSISQKGSPSAEGSTSKSPDVTADENRRGSSESVADKTPRSGRSSVDLGRRVS